MNLKNRVALITGASSGIGWETALSFAAKGSRLALAARSENKLKELAKAIEENDGNCIVSPVDVTNTDSVNTMVQTVVQHYGRIDILINNAGIGVFAPLLDADIQDMKNMMDVNYFGVVRCIQAVVPYMVKQKMGHVVNVASVAGFFATPTHGGYSATKYAVIGLSEALREEVRDAGINVSTINPGPIDTPFFGKAEKHELPKVTQLFMQKPDRVAHAIVRAVEQEIPQVMVPESIATFVKCKALMPILFARGAGRFYRKSKSSDYAGD